MTAIQNHTNQRYLRRYSSQHRDRFVRHLFRCSAGGLRDWVQVYQICERQTLSSPLPVTGKQQLVSDGQFSDVEVRVS